MAAQSVGRPKTAGQVIRDEFVVLAETLPCQDGWEWAVVEYRRYHRACQDGVPTLHLEHKVDDEVTMVYLVGVADLQAGGA